MNTILLKWQQLTDMYLPDSPYYGLPLHDKLIIVFGGDLILLVNGHSSRTKVVYWLNHEPYIKIYGSYKRILSKKERKNHGGTVLWRPLTPAMKKYWEMGYE